MDRSGTPGSSAGETTSTTSATELSPRKRCSKCGETHPIDAFGKDRSTASGLAHWCRACCRRKNKALYQKDRPRRLEYVRERYAADPEAFRAKNKAAYVRNPDLLKRLAKRWAADNREKVREKSRRQYAANPERAAERWRKRLRERPEWFSARSALRRAQIARATVAWANVEKMEVIYQEAARLTRETGIKHEVDHVVPLISPVVCGLHWEGNLQVLTSRANRVKSNKFNQDG